MAAKYNLQEDLFKASSLRKEGKLQEAFDAFTKLAEQLEDDGFDAKAAAVAGQALQTIRCPEAYANLAEIQRRRGFTAAAEDALTKAYEMCIEKGDRQQAEAYLQAKQELALLLTGADASSEASPSELDPEIDEAMEAALLHFIIGDAGLWKRTWTQ